MDLTLGAALLGAAQGQLGSLVNKWLDYKYKLKHLKSKTYLDDMRQVRNAKCDQFLITRRILALLTGCYIFLFPMMMAWMAIPVHISYLETNGFFASLVAGSQSLTWKTFLGFVMTPTQTYLASLTWTMYFGGKNVW